MVHARSRGIDAIVVNTGAERVLDERFCRFFEELSTLEHPPPFVLVSGSPSAPADSARLGAAAFLPRPCSARDLDLVLMRMAGPKKSLASRRAPAASAPRLSLRALTPGGGSSALAVAGPLGVMAPVTSGIGSRSPRGDGSGHFGSMAPVTSGRWLRSLRVDGSHPFRGEPGRRSSGCGGRLPLAANRYDPRNDDRQIVENDERHRHEELRIDLGGRQDGADDEA